MIIKGQSKYFETIFGQFADFANTSTEAISHNVNHLVKVYANSVKFLEVCFIWKYFPFLNAFGE